MICGKQTGPGFKPENVLPCPLESGHEGYCHRPDDSEVVAVLTERDRCARVAALPEYGDTGQDIAWRIRSGKRDSVSHERY